MPLKRIAKFSIIITVAIVCVLTCAYYYFFHVYMPAHFQENVLPALMKDAGISGFSGKVKSAGPSEANLGELSIGDPKNPALKVRSVIIKYSFQNIFAPRTPDVTSLEFNGLELVCRMTDKRFEVNNIDIEKFIEQLKKHFSGKHKKAIGSWGNTKLKISNGLINLNWNGTKLLLPFELLFNPEQQNWEIFRADLKFSWRDHPIKAKLLVDLNKKTTEIKFNARTEMKKLLNLVGKSKKFKTIPELKLAGLINLKGNISFGFSPWKIKELKVSGTSKSCEIHYGALSIHNKQRRSAQKIPLTISVSSDGENYIWKLKNGLVKKPTEVFVREMSCIVPLDERKVMLIEGDFEFNLGKHKLFKYYNINNVSNVNLIRKITGRFNQSTKNWHLKTAETGDYARKTPIKSIATCGDTKIFANISELGFSGRGCGKSGDIKVKMLVKEISATGKQNAFFCNNVEFDSNFKIVPATDGKVRIKNNRFKLLLPELFSSSLDNQVKIKDLTINGSNSFNGFKMNGFQLNADTEKINIKQNNELFTGKNNKLTLDGIFMKNKNQWELSIFSYSEAIEGNYKNNDFNLKNAQSKNSLSLTGSLFNLDGIKNCNVRLKCDAGEYGNKEEYSKFSGFDIGTALVFDDRMHLIKKTLSGKIKKIDVKYKDSDIAVSGLKMTSRFNPDNKEKKDMDLLGNIKVKSISLRQNKIKYLSKLARFKLTGKTFAKLLTFKYLKADLNFPELLVTRGKEQVKIVNTSLKTDISFHNSKIINSWHHSMKNINSELAFDRISGIWEKINILSSKSKIKVKAEVGLKKSALYLKKMNAVLNVEKTIAFNKSWKLGCQRISATSSSSSTASKLTLKPILKLHAFYVASHDASFLAPEATITATLNEGKLSGILFSDQASFQKKNLNLLCKQISMRLPFGVDAAEGEIDINKIELRKQNLGKLSAKLKIEDDKLIVNANHFSEIFSNASMFFSGKMKFSEFPAWEGDFKIPEFKVKKSSNVSILFPEMGVKFQGKTALEGHLDGDFDKCKGSGIISVKEGILSFNSWKLNNVTAICSFTDLFNAKSAPRQKLTCKWAKNASLKFTNMQLEFQSYGAKKLQVERMSADWFGGRLTSLTPFAIENNNSVPEKVNFLSSKITLSPFLDYLGIKGFATDAFVGGIIPFSVKDNRVFISDASLATKTSNRGFLCMNDNWNKYIKLGADKSQINKKKFIAAALKRFNYNWIRLNVVTTPKRSNVELNIDGYPDKAVPFKYDPEKSLFIPVFDSDLGINSEMTIETKFSIPRKKGN